MLSSSPILPPFDLVSIVWKKHSHAMLSMNKLLFMHTLIICVIAGDNNWKTFRVTFDEKNPGLHNIPLTVGQAKEEGYVKSATHEDFCLIHVYCLDNDPRGCPMYDTYGKLCGFRVGYVHGTLSKKCHIESYYHYETIKTFKKGTIFKTMKYYYVDLMFHTPASLMAGGPECRESPVGDCLYVKLDGQTWSEIPTKEEDILSLPGMVNHTCYEKMGQHYFFIDKNTVCTDAIPFFTMFDKGSLSSAGMVTFGSTNKHCRDWYEDVPHSFPYAIFTDPAQCFPDTIDACGALGVHMYFVEKPEDITCPK